MSKLNPAAKVISLFGGVRPLARALDLNPSAVSRWAQPTVKKGTNGAIPQRHWAAILQHAAAEKVKLTVNDLAGL